jgi:GntR family transcriptional repressor for pyruvate dehydrogenase complex
VRDAGTGEKIALRIARMIAREVAQNHLPPGTMLAPEQEMARRFGVGRPSVREALRLLETQGLIVLRPGVKGGPMVASPTGADLGQTMTMFLQMRNTPLREVIDAGAELAGLMASLAARRVGRDGASVEPLREVLEQERVHLYDEQRLTHGIEFHHRMHALASNEVLTLLIDAVGGIVADRTRTYRHDVWSADEVRAAYEDHVKMLRAIERGDARRAAELTRDHMTTQSERDFKAHPEMARAIVDWR